MAIMDKSRVIKAVHDELVSDCAITIEVPKVQYLNNIVEQDHHAVKCVTQPVLEFKSFRAAQAILAAVEFLYRIGWSQFSMAHGELMSTAEPFYKLTGQGHPK